MSTLYLSRARLRHDASARALAPLLLPRDESDRAHAAHRLVWSLMSDAAERSRDFLWREERHGHFLILGPRPAERQAELFELEHKPWEPVLQAGDRLGFALRANPTIARQMAPGQRGKRSDVVMDALYALPSGTRAEARTEAIVTAGTAWLTRQGARLGFTPEDTTLKVDGYETIRIERVGDEDRHDRWKPAPLSFGRLDFEGVLRVQDPAVFLAAVAQGFGRARAFGCGLMLLRRA